MASGIPLVTVSKRRTFALKGTLKMYRSQLVRSTQKRNKVNIICHYPLTLRPQVRTKNEKESLGAVKFETALLKHSMLLLDLHLKESLCFFKVIGSQ